MKRILPLSVCLALLSGCASTESEPEINKQLNQNDNVPGWVFNPVEKDGIASATCVPWSGNMQIDRSEALAQARIALAQQLDIRVASIEKILVEKESAVEAKSSSSFEQVSEQLSKAHINGAMVKQVSFATIDSKKQLCALVTIDAASTKQLFDELLEARGTDIEPLEEKEIFERFKLQAVKDELKSSEKGSES
ncbi:hypothetical protein [Ferrimonas sp.]|uniref:hypothetical protein n=1 Tax=Ferrimonas sp. TaxID=2080861 RepID=UPI003A8D3EE3